MKIRRIWIVLTLAFLAGMLAFYILLPRISEVAAVRYLESLGYAGVEVSVAKIHWNRVVIDLISIESAGVAVILKEVDGQFSLRDVIREGRLVSLNIGEARAVLGLNEPLPDEEATEDPMSIDDIFSVIEGFPIDSVLLRKGEIVVGMEGRSLPLHINFSFERESEARVAMNSILKVSDNKVVASAYIENDVASFDFAANISDIAPDLDRYFSNWKELFFEQDVVVHGVGAIDFEIQGEVQRDGALYADTKLSVESLTLAFDIMEGDFKGLDVSTRIEGTEFFGDFEFSIESLYRDDLQVPAQKLAFQFELKQLSELSLKSLLPVSWIYSDGVARGTSSVNMKVLLPVDDSALQFEGQVESDNLWVSDWGLSSHLGHLRGNMDALSFDAPFVGLVAYPNLGLNDLSVVVDFPPETENVVIAARGQFDGGDFSDFVVGFENGPLAMIAEYASDETGEADISILVESADNEQDFIFRLPDRFKARGNLKLRADARLTNDSESIENAVINIDLIDVSAQGESWSVDGASAQSEMNLALLELSAFEEYEALSNEKIEELVRQVDWSLDWQANQMNYDGVSAQWSYGNTRSPLVAKSEFPIWVESSASIGILDLEEESIQQVSLSSRAYGNLQKVDQNVDLGFLFLGNEGKVTTQSRIEGLDAEQISIIGEYALDPFDIVYSDILGRYFDAAEGSSVSGRVSASGSFDLVDGVPLISSELRLEAGSLDSPGAQLSVVGIAAEAAFESVLDLRTAGEGVHLEVGQVEVGDLIFMNATMDLDLLSGSALRLRNGSLEAMGGVVSLRDTVADLDRFDLESKLLFENLSLNEIMSKVEFFDGTMEGEVNGSLPIAFRNGSFLPQEGMVSLTDGRTARLAYNAAGMFASDDTGNSKKTLGDRLFAILDIEPERFVEEALMDLKINDLSIRLFPEGSPLTPVRIRFSGEGRSGETKIPLSLEANINGNLEELYLFLMRLNSMSAPIKMK